MHTQWVGWIRDMWLDKPWQWSRAILGHGGEVGFPTEAVCMHELHKAYQQCDSNGFSRYSKLALPDGVPPCGPTSEKAKEG